MFISIAGICFLIIGGISANIDPTLNEIELEDNMLDEVEHRENLQWPRVFEIFDVCELSCLGKACKCCHHVLSVVPVCGALYIDPTAKTAELSLTITGRTAISLIISLNRFLNFCRTTETKLGEVDFCANSTISEHDTNPDSFRICMEGEVQLNKVKHLHVTVNCLEFKGDFIFESDDDKEFGKNIASVKIHNQLILANVIRKAITDNIIG